MKTREQLEIIGGMLVGYEGRLRWEESLGFARANAIARMALDSAAYMTLDEAMAARDNNLATYQHQLEKVDPMWTQPLMNVTYSRDINMRGDVEMSDEAVSFFRETFQGTGTVNVQGIPWVDPNATELPGVSIDGKKVTAQVRLAAREAIYTGVALDKSRRYGRPLDQAQFNAINKLYQLGTDKMVYIGDTVVEETGLVNNAGTPRDDMQYGDWDDVGTSADEIIEDFREANDQYYQNTGQNFAATDCLMAPTAFSSIVHKKVGTTGDRSVASWLQENSLANAINGKPIRIRPSKWCTGRGNAGANRMVLYRNESDLIRFAMVPIRREMAYNRGLFFCAPFLWAYASVEFLHPETVLYRDGL